MNHFKGVVAGEKWKNEMLEINRGILNELRAIRQHLERDAQTVKVEPVKRTYKRRSDKS